MTWKGFTIAMIPLATALVAVNRDSVMDLESKIESRVSRDEFVQHIQAQNRWQDRMDSRMDALSAAAVQQTNDMTQAQYILVQRPLTAEELHDQRVREILSKQGKIDAAP